MTATSDVVVLKGHSILPSKVLHNTHSCPHTAQYLAVRRLLDGKDERDRETGKARDGRITVTFDDVRQALRAVRPSAMREVAIEVPKVGNTAY